MGIPPWFHRSFCYVKKILVSIWRLYVNWQSSWSETNTSNSRHYSDMHRFEGPPFIYVSLHTIYRVIYRVIMILFGLFPESVQAIDHNYTPLPNPGQYGLPDKPAKFSRSLWPLCRRSPYTNDCSSISGSQVRIEWRFWACRSPGN